MKTRFAIIVAMLVITYNGWCQEPSDPPFFKGHYSLNYHRGLIGKPNHGFYLIFDKRIAGQNHLGLLFGLDWSQTPKNDTMDPRRDLNGVRFSYMSIAVGPHYSYTLSANNHVCQSVELSLGLTFRSLGMTANDERCRIWRDSGDSGGRYTQYFHLCPKGEKDWGTHLGLQMMLAYRLSLAPCLTTTFFIRHELMTDPVFEQLDRTMALHAEWKEFGDYYEEPVMNLYRIYRGSLDGLKSRMRFQVGISVGFGF